MIIPENPHDKRATVKWLLDTCLMSRQDRKEQYDRRRQYFLFGTSSEDEVKYNRIESHLDLVASFLYSSDHAQFSLAAPLNSDDEQVKRFIAAQDSFNDIMADSGLFDAFGTGIVNALMWDSVIGKVGWSKNHEQPTLTLISPSQFGVLSEEETELENQQAFVHSYHIDYDQAVQRLTRAGLKSKIPDLAVVNTPYESPFPEMITRMIISSTGGENLQGNVSGAINPSYIQRPTYMPLVNRPMVGWHELTVWDDDCEDYRQFWVCDPDIIISDSKATIDVLKRSGGHRAERKQAERFYATQCNGFIAHEHPYFLIRPYEVHEYFWGKAHIDSLIKLQDWSNERLEQIHDLLERQAYPPRVGSGFLGLTDEKMEAFGGADTWVMDQLPQAAIKELHPEMPPDIFADYMQIGQLFMEASGLTEVIMGKGTAGVRSKSHAKELNTTGSGRIKKAATRLEAPLVRMGDLAFKLCQRNSDHEIIPDPKENGAPGDAFLLHELGDDYTLRIAGHSHSPLFADDTKELAAFLFKAQAVDREALLRLLPVPNRDNLIHALRAREKKMAQLAMMRGQTPGGGPPLQGKARSASHGTSPQA